MNVNFKSFKPYSYYQNKSIAKNEKPKLNKKALLGSATGVLSGLVIGPQLVKMGKIKNNTVKEVVEMLSMAGLANLFSVLFVSFKEPNKEQTNKKWREAGFQIMNTSIPMLMVSGVNEFCNNSKNLNNKPAKIIGSIVGMVGGAALATKITNLDKKEGEIKRKYSIKDSVANFDDVVATIVIGFPQYQKLNSIAKSVLPFIYTYCGTRAGSKE